MLQLRKSLSIRPLAVLVLVLIISLLSACSKPTETESATPATQPANADWEKIDHDHEKGVMEFPAKTEGTGNQPLAHELDGSVKVFRLKAGKVQWEVSPGKKVDAYAYNGQIPGPTIRVTEGDRVRVIVENAMDESTAVHWHGLRLSNEADGVPYITQPPIKPGETFTYEFTAANAGTHMYHSHHNAVAQVTGGQLGALIVDPKDPAARDRYGETQDMVMVLNDGRLGYTLNGKGFPATTPIKAKLGEKIRIRFLNEGQTEHPMHIHGLTMLVVERDGYPLPQPFKLDTLNVAPGERWDVIIDADNPGAWAFHCHILSHAESEHGMHGMVTVLFVE